MSVFLDFQLPSQATWFYWSLLLVVTLFFQFARWWSLRNLDLLSLYLLVPGMLLVQAGHTNPAESGLRTSGYIALLFASGYWLLRTLFDRFYSDPYHRRYHKIVPTPRDLASTPFTGANRSR